MRQPPTVRPQTDEQERDIAFIRGIAEIRVDARSSRGFRWRNAVEPQATSTRVSPRSSADTMAPSSLSIRLSRAERRVFPTRSQTTAGPDDRM